MIEKVSENPITPDKLKEDVDFLFKTIKEVHPNMYAYTSEEEVTKHLEVLYRQMDHPLSHRNFYNLIAPVVASLKNGHTYVCPFSFTGDDKIFPIGLHWKGQNVMLAHDYGTNTLPLGSTVLTFNGEDAHEVTQKLARYFPDENKNANLQVLECYKFFVVFTLA